MFHAAVSFSSCRISSLARGAKPPIEMPVTATDSLEPESARRRSDNSWPGSMEWSSDVVLGEPDENLARTSPSTRRNEESNMVTAENVQLRESPFAVGLLGFLKRAEGAPTKLCMAETQEMRRTAQWWDAPQSKGVNGMIASILMMVEGCLVFSNRCNIFGYVRLWRVRTFTAILSSLLLRLCSCLVDNRAC